MVWKVIRVILAVGSVLALCGIGVCAGTAKQAPKLLRLSVGSTIPIQGEAGSFERALVLPPDGETTTAGNAWEISADVAIRLARLPRDVRWLAIRRNIGLAPDDTDDLILWSEVDEAAFASIAKLPLSTEPGVQAYGLRVAFPDKSTSDPPPDVALTFAGTQTERTPGKQPNIESDLRSKIATATTGVEGFVEFAPDGVTPPPLDALTGMEVKLLDSEHKVVATTQLRQGYFCFTGLAVDPDFGSDYYLQTPTGDGAMGMLLRPKDVYVPVMPGIRTRVRLTVQRPLTAAAEKGITTNWPINGGPAAMLLQQFVEGNSILSAITERLPANPGLHLGIVQVPGMGPTTLWSARFVLKPPILDRRPQFVSRGRMRLQCLTIEATQGTARYHYVKLTWLGHAEPAELKLASRHISETPWGIGVGVAPSADPALYAVGASYKLLPTAELLAGVGFQEGHSDSFIYGITFDADKILNGVLGRKGQGQ